MKNETNVFGVIFARDCGFISLSQVLIAKENSNLLRSVEAKESTFIARRYNFEHNQHRNNIYIFVRYYYILPIPQFIY